jgi:MoaA/NifB/PqqE/SkfB family radical SAM enzyme
MSGRRKPRVAWRALRNHLHLIVTGEPLLRSVSLSVGYKCNLRCIHCSAAKFMDRGREELRRDDVRRLGDELARNGVYIVQLTGGEPLLRPDLEEVIRALDPRRFYVSVNTSSTLVTPARLASLRDAGLDNVGLSIDAWEAAEHDRFRRRDGIHAQSLRALDMILDAGLGATVFAVVTHQNGPLAGLSRSAYDDEELGVPASDHS